ncbi:TetR/AcrR family transcriptional regulator [Cellulomonas dongxiuzhuiae]|uniref:TetR/AcrR family transcriptional regulator n=1 Tax=Cellulomonas dongxiuzhuiae TaxID=2819979 RepID=A0ABX8GMH9_9CELL|nr:TetR/AcrR family transcriptional regulator [Cellulomonas dongxiuzhuiae]MBO3096060.1 TetR/AcrR family transcriptional regulator [Cellulomonas dongxiuzhuiae]QWC17334.1 TetR/AcrR family transcriptional regulator [Cellulomonas dongxiuzhuiae]
MTSAAQHPTEVAAAPSGVGLRERKKTERRTALIDASHRLVAAHGLEAVTVEMICAEVGVSPRTFFNYFATKDDAVLGHLPWAVAQDVADTFVAGGPTGVLRDDLVELVVGLVAAPPLGAERVRRTLELVTHHPRLMAHHIAWMDQQKSQLERLVRERLADGSPHRPETLTALLVVCAHATLLRWDAAGGDGHVREHATAVVAELRAVLTD